jgi:hypothetical protein
MLELYLDFLSRMAAHHCLNIPLTLLLINVLLTILFNLSNINIFVPAVIVEQHEQAETSFVRRHHLDARRP